MIEVRELARAKLQMLYDKLQYDSDINNSDAGIYKGYHSLRRLPPSCSPQLDSPKMSDEENKNIMFHTRCMPISFLLECARQTPESIRARTSIIALSAICIIGNSIRTAN